MSIRSRGSVSFKRGVMSSFQTFQGAAYTEVNAGMEPAQGQQPQQVHPSQVWPGPQQPPQFGNPPQGWQPNGSQQFPGQQPNVPPPAQGWPPNNGTPPQ